MAWNVQVCKKDAKLENPRTDCCNWHESCMVAGKEGNRKESRKENRKESRKESR
jgi:hypothetical protein